MSEKRFIFGSFVVLLILSVLPLFASGAKEQKAVSYPSGPVTAIIPWPAGGRTDIAARVWAPFLEKELGFPVVVQNMPGAGGVTGSNNLIRAKNDGHTFGVLSISLNLAQWTKTPPFELKKLEPVCMIFASPMTVTVRANSPWKTLQEFIEYGRKNPGKIRQANSGTGTSQHVISAAFFKAAGVEVIHVPYDGDGPAVTALVNGEVDTSGAPMIALRTFIASNTVRVLAVTGQKRSPLSPDIPTVKEQGIDFALESFDGIYVPLGTPREIIDALDAAFKRMSEKKEFIEAMHKIAYEIAYMTSAEFRNYLVAVNSTLEKIVTDLGLRVAP